MKEGHLAQGLIFHGPAVLPVSALMLQGGMICPDRVAQAKHAGCRLCMQGLAQSMLLPLRPNAAAWQMSCYLQGQHRKSISGHGWLIKVYIYSVFNAFL